MEVLIEKKEGIEDKNERCKQNGVETETFAVLIEEERLESSSSSDIFLTSEMTGHEEEEQSHSSSESSSPPSLGWPIQKAEEFITDGTSRVTDLLDMSTVAQALHRAMSHAEIQVPRVRLGNQGLEVSRLGFGCAGLTGGYSDPLSDEEGISVIKHAFSKGITFFDTADVYGANANEIMVGKALRQLPRDKIQLATKFGLLKVEADGMEVCGRPEYVRSCCEASLKRLGVDYIDLYYQHRIDKLVPIEDTMEELKKLVEEGKIKYIGLSEASPDTIRRAHAVHPITTLQMEWSLWTRDIEEEIVPLCRELGIGIVAYSPLGHGFFGGRTAIESGPAVGLMSTHPRFTGENLDKNKVLYERVVKLASKYGCTSAQLSLSWLLHQGDDVIPIPGTTKIKHVDDNVSSLKVKLTAEDLKEITDAVAINEVAGARIHAGIELYSWRFVNTPSKSDNASEHDS